MVDRKRNYKDRDNRVEWEERVVSVQRVTKVVKGGKKIEFPCGCCCWRPARKSWSWSW